MSTAINPFPGLRPFRTEEKGIFFGRDAESAEVCDKLLKNKFVAIIGTPGCGKSSFVNCTILPKMAVLTISFSPGSDPFSNMEDAFLQVTARTSVRNRNENEDRLFVPPLKGDPDWINSALRNMTIRSGEKVLINIDQFEEIFTYNNAQKDIAYYQNAAEFVSLILNSLKQSIYDIHVIISISSNYLGDCAHLPGLTLLINNSNFLLSEISTENYKAIIEKPLIASGIEIEPKLSEVILKDFGYLPAPLALIQHVMSRTYDHWKNFAENGRPVSFSDYSDSGKIKNAVTLHAEEVFKELSNDGKQVCRKLFRAITGKGPENNGIRHPLKVSQIRLILHCSDEELSEVIEKFRDFSISFITPPFGSTLNSDSVVNISYECLIDHWDRLKAWIEEEVNSVNVYNRLSEAAAMFQKGKTTLLKNPELQIALNWREEQKPTVEWAERYDPAFERAMVFLRTSEKAYNEEEDLRKKITKRRIWKNRLTILILAFAGLVLLGLVFFIYSRKLNSDRQKSAVQAKADHAEQQVLIAGKKLNIADSTAQISSRNVKEAIEMNKVSENKRMIAERIAARERTSGLQAEAKAKNAANLRDEAIRRRMISVGKTMSLRSMQLSGQRELQSLLAYQAYLFNKSYGGSINDADIFNGLYNVAKQYGNVNYRTFSGHDGGIKNIAFLPGKNQFFTSGSDGKVLKWDLEGKNQNIQVIYSGSDIINVLAVSPDAGWLACGEQNAGIIMIPLKSSNISYELKGHTGPVKSLIFSYDGRYLYSASLDGKVLRWDLSTKTATDISVNIMQMTSIDISSDNKYIAGWGSGGNALIFNPDVTTDTFAIKSGGKTIKTMRFKPDENKLAVGYSDGYVELWDIDKKEKISVIKAHAAAVNDIQFNTKNMQIATAGDDRSVRLWDLNDLTALPVIFDDNEGFVVTLAFSSDGQVIVSGTSSGSNNLASRPARADDLAKDLCSEVSRNLTIEEWWAYVGKDIEYVKTCPESEFKIKVNVIK